MKSQIQIQKCRDYSRSLNLKLSNAQRSGDQQGANAISIITHPSWCRSYYTDPVAATARHCRRPPDPTSPRLQLLHGPFNLPPLQTALPDGNTLVSHPLPTSACQTGSRTHTAPIWSGQSLLADAASPLDGSCVTSPSALIWSTAENKPVEDNPKLPFWLPCAHRDGGSCRCLSGLCSASVSQATKRRQGA